MRAADNSVLRWTVVRVTADGELEQKKKKKDEEKEKKVKKGRVTKISDVSDEDADGGGWEAVKGGVITVVVSECWTLQLLLIYVNEVSSTCKLITWHVVHSLNILIIGQCYSLFFQLSPKVIVLFWGPCRNQKNSGRF